MSASATQGGHNERSRTVTSREGRTSRSLEVDDRIRLSSADQRRCTMHKVQCRGESGRQLPPVCSSRAQDPSLLAWRLDGRGHDHATTEGPRDWVRWHASRKN